MSPRVPPVDGASGLPPSPTEDLVAWVDRLEKAIPRASRGLTLNPEIGHGRGWRDLRRVAVLRSAEATARDQLERLRRQRMDKWRAYRARLDEEEARRARELAQTEESLRIDAFFASMDRAIKRRREERGGRNVPEKRPCQAAAWRSRGRRRFSLLVVA